MSILKMGKSQAEKLQELQQQAEGQYQEGMLRKLKVWALENECSVEALVMPNITPYQVAFQGTLHFRKLTPKEIEELKKAEELKIIQPQNGQTIQ